MGSPPRRLADLLPLAWLAAFVWASQAAPAILGDRRVGGQPLWRCVVALPTQLGLFPLLWSRRLGEEASVRAFSRLFAAYMIADLLLLGDVMSTTLRMHHYACLCGHATVLATMAPPAVALYFDGVFALELGSGCMNVFLALAPWLGRPLAAATYVLGMTGSNLAALAILRQWWRLRMSRAQRAITVGLTLALVSLRQHALHNNLSIHG